MFLSYLLLWTVLDIICHMWFREVLKLKKWGWYRGKLEVTQESQKGKINIRVVYRNIKA